LLVKEVIFTLKKMSNNLQYSFLMMFFWCLPLTMKAQFCTGTLGDNIFVAGDFGSGTSNLLSPNPNIAPGYNYTFNVPPIDGQYVITNNTAGWPLWASWLGIGDNSSDPNGYMMVVNASNSPGLFYEQTVTGLCENTLYEFSADIINLIKTGTPDHIDPDVSFLLDGVELFTTGNIPKTQNWVTYGFTFTTAVGQQSLTLSLQNNAPGGNGNDLAIDNISFRACGPETTIGPGTSTIHLCENDPPVQLQATIIGNQYVNPVVQWQQSFDEGLSWVDIAGASANTYLASPSMAGSYYYRFLVADGASNLASENCRVNSAAKIIKILAAETVLSVSICEGSTLALGDSTYAESGIYQDTLVNFLGCDSILITNLTVESDPTFMADLLVTPPCGNLSDGSITVSNLTGGTAPFNYTFEGLDVGEVSTFSDLAGGQSYFVLVQDSAGCVIELAAYMENPADVILELGDNQIIELGETVTLKPFYNFVPSGFNWQSNTVIDCINFDDCNQLDFIPTTSQQVILELFINETCAVSDSIFIEVIDVRKAWLPNAFSPNGDGANDFFTVFGNTSNASLVEDLKIYDRWGGLVFQGENILPNDLQNGWDGTRNGEALDPGLFVYTARVRFVDGLKLLYAGDVFLAK
jgi:gliding motility-associated-like protein